MIHKDTLRRRNWTPQFFEAPSTDEKAASVEAAGATHLSSDKTAKKKGCIPSYAGFSCQVTKETKGKRSITIRFDSS